MKKAQYGKVAFLLLNTKNNGGNRVVLEYCSRLLKKGYDARAYAIFGTSSGWFRPPVKVQNALPLLFRRDNDTVIATFWLTVWYAFFISAKRKIYLVQGWEEDLYKNLLLRKLAKITHILPFEKIAISRFVKQQILKYFPKSIVYQIRAHGIDGIYMRKVQKFTSAIKILSVVSNYGWGKGVDLLDRAIRTLKENHPGYHFTLVSMESKPYSSVFDEFYSKLNQNELGRLYRRSDILLATSRKEGFFLPGLEAMANGCIFFTTRCGGVEDYAKNRYNAIFIEPRANLYKNGFIDKVLRNLALKKRLIQNGYETAAGYSWKRAVDELEVIITKTT